MFTNFHGKCFLFCLVKWPSLDESVSLCICLLTVVCNREMQPLFLLAIHCGGGGDFRSGSSSSSKLKCAARVGSSQTISGTGFTLKPVQTSSTQTFDACALCLIAIPLLA